MANRKSIQIRKNRCDATESRFLDVPSRARVFWTSWRLVRFATDVPARRELQKSSQEPTVAAGIVFFRSLSSKRNTNVMQCTNMEKSWVLSAYWWKDTMLLWFDWSEFNNKNYNNLVWWHCHCMRHLTKCSTNSKVRAMSAQQTNHTLSCRGLPRQTPSSSLRWWWWWQDCFVENKILYVVFRAAFIWNTHLVSGKLFQQRFVQYESCWRNSKRVRFFFIHISLSLSLSPPYLSFSLKLTVIVCVHRWIFVPNLGATCYRGGHVDKSSCWQNSIS